jgi:putative sterol carrier protein
MSLVPVTEKVKALADKGQAIGSSIKFAFTGEEGVVFLDGTGETNVVSNEDKPADCTVRISLEDFHSLLSGELSPMSAFFTGKIKLDGDMAVAMKLGALFN